MNLHALAIVLALAGCSSIDRHAAPPADWPELRVVVHKSGFMAKRECDGAIGGCAAPNFCAKRCDIYLQIDSRAIETHERAHCAGYDHPGNDTMRAGWLRYRDGDQAAFCALRMGTANYCRLWSEDAKRCGTGVEVPGMAGAG